MLTKSNFMLYLEAPMHLWAEKHGQANGEPPSAFQIHIMNQGYEVERYAREYLVHHVLPQYDNAELIWQKTLQDGQYETRTDALILDHTTNQYDLYEIKSSTSVKKEYHYDVAFQALICEKELPLNNQYLLYLNNEYMLDGELELSKLFALEDMASHTAAIQAEVLQEREKAYHLMQDPNNHTAATCLKPKDCPCPELCFGKLPEHSIFELSGLRPNKKQVLMEQNILSIADIPADFSLNHKQQLQQEAVQNGPLIDTQKIAELLSDLEYPLYFLDYETFNPAIPRYQGYKPHQHMVFQYSLHTLRSSESELEHTEYLCLEEGDPAAKVLAQLQEEIGPTGSVIVWYKHFEKQRNKEMAALYPEYADFLMGINERVFDLMDVFKYGYYVDAQFQGSCSIKKVLPVLVPELSYDNLDIRGGDMAMIAWWEAVQGELSTAELNKVERDLLEYCELDTLAMVEIWRGLG